MKVKKLICLFVVFSMLFVMAACSGNSTSTQVEEKPVEEIVLKFGHVLAPTHPYNLGAEKFKEILEANAPQPVKVEIYHSSQLGSERDMTEGLQLGTIDMAIAPGTIGSFEPKMGVLDLPYIFRDREHAYKVLDGEIGKELASNLPANGLRLLAYWENGFRQITNSRKPINTPEDLKGLKIRVPENKTYVSAFNEWGANVTTMAFGELYTALQQKTIDAQENPLAIISTNKFYEIQEYISMSSHFYGPAQVLIAESTWTKISPEMREAVQKAVEEARDYERQLLMDLEAEYIEGLKEEGMQVNEVNKDAFQESAKAVWETYRSEYGDLIDRIANTK